MAEQFTNQRFEELMGGLHELYANSNQAGDFDTAELAEEALLFLRPHRGTYAEAIIKDDAPLVGDMVTLRQMAGQMKELQIKAEDFKAAASDVRGDLDELRLRKIPEMMEALQVKTTVFTGLGRLQVASDLYASTKKGQKDSAMAWLRDCGYEGMITEGYNASSLKALFRRMIVDGSMPPEEIFNVTPFSRASIVKV